MLCSKSTPSSELPLTGTPITGNPVIAATIPGRCAAPPAPATITRSPRPDADRAYSTSRSGVRCADTIVNSYGIWNWSSICAAGNITGRSESDPMIIPTSGCLWENTEPGCCASGAYRSISEAVLPAASAPGRRCSSWRRRARSSASKFAVIAVSHLAALTTLSLAIKVHARTRHAKRKLCKPDELGHVVR